MSRRTRRACATTRVPSRVRHTPVGRNSNSRPPNSLSRRARMRLSAGWAMASRPATATARSRTGSLRRSNISARPELRTAGLRPGLAGCCAPTSGRFVPFPCHEVSPAVYRPPASLRWSPPRGWTCSRHACMRVAEDAMAPRGRATASGGIPASLRPTAASLSGSTARRCCSRSGVTTKWGAVPQGAVPAGVSWRCAPEDERLPRPRARQQYAAPEPEPSSRRYWALRLSASRMYGSPVKREEPWIPFGREAVLAYASTAERNEEGNFEQVLRVTDSLRFRYNRCGNCTGLPA